MQGFSGVSRRPAIYSIRVQLLMIRAILEVDLKGLMTPIMMINVTRGVSISCTLAICKKLNIGNVIVNAKELFNG